MIKKTEFRHFRDLFSEYVVKDIGKLLVLGCGELRYELNLGAKVIFGVDWADSQLAKAKEKENVIVIKYDLLSVCNIIPDKSFDCVAFFDVIEHLQKPDALHLLQMVEHKVKRQIIMFVPVQEDLGNLDEIIMLQEERKANNMPMGYHLSKWNCDELSDLGYIGEYSSHYHQDKNMGAIFCVKNL